MKDVVLVDEVNHVAGIIFIGGGAVSRKVGAALGSVAAEPRGDAKAEPGAEKALLPPTPATP